MLRACWVGCVVVFAAFAIACGGSTKPTEPRTEGLKSPLTIDGLTVQIFNAGVGAAQTVKGPAEGEYLMMAVELVSADPAKKFNYKSWVDGGTVTDDRGKQYRPIILPAAPVGRTVYATVTSEKVVRDVLIFEKPVQAAKYLDIDLPAPPDVGKAFRFRVYTKDLLRE